MPGASHSIMSSSECRCAAPATSQPCVLFVIILLDDANVSDVSNELHRFLNMMASSQELSCMCAAGAYRRGPCRRWATSSSVRSRPDPLPACHPQTSSCWRWLSQVTLLVDASKFAQSEPDLHRHGGTRSCANPTCLQGLIGTEGRLISCEHDPEMMRHAV
jgi:hypothetical protein